MFGFLNRDSIFFGYNFGWIVIDDNIKFSSSDISKEIAEKDFTSVCLFVSELASLIVDNIVI
jgi:hypothetical protein